MAAVGLVQIGVERGGADGVAVTYAVECSRVGVGQLT